MREKKRSANGFTLVELVIVTIVIGILIAVSIPVYTNAVEKSKGAKALQNLHNIRTAEIAFGTANEFFTTDLATLAGFGQFSATDAEWAYSAALPTATTFIITATRVSTNSYNGETIDLDQSGAITYSTGTTYP